MGPGLTDKTTRCSDSVLKCSCGLQERGDHLVHGQVGTLVCRSAEPVRVGGLRALVLRHERHRLVCDFLDALQQHTLSVLWRETDDHEVSPVSGPACAGQRNGGGLGSDLAHMLEL